MHAEWNFRKLRAEVTVAQQIIVNDIKEHLKRDGLRLSIDEHRPSRHQGTKEERIAAALEHRYDNQMVWHYKGGFTPVLEEELVLARPPHDDVKDALASAIEIIVKPKANRKPELLGGGMGLQTHSRFGGVRFS